MPAIKIGRKNSTASTYGICIEQSPIAGAQTISNYPQWRTIRGKGIPLSHDSVSAQILNHQTMSTLSGVEPLSGDSVVNFILRCGLHVVLRLGILSWYMK